MNNNGVFHLTVNPKGMVSLWDSAQAAAKGKQHDEVQVSMSLTRAQIVDLIRAETLARSKVVERRGPHSGVSASGDGY